MLNNCNSLMESMVVKKLRINKGILVQLQNGFENCLTAVAEANGTWDNQSAYRPPFKYLTFNFDHL